jgi:predicted nucleotidyltransferase
MREQSAASELTRFSDLNAVLAELVADLRVALGDNLHGAYLVGSFAVGDADEHSDVDFIVATQRELDAEEQRRLQAVHAALYALPVAWAQHLEGSYAPKDVLRTVDARRRPFFYLDNGARELIWDDHCNTAVVRWTLREHGVVMVGPPPDDLVAPVDPDELRAEARTTMREAAKWARETGALGRWAQQYLVLSFCRMLHTLESGRVVSKRAAGAWALRELDPRWHDLISTALADRPHTWELVHQRASSQAAAETLAFIDASLAG